MHGMMPVSPLLSQTDAPAIPREPRAHPATSWQRALAEAVRNRDELLTLLELPPEPLPAATEFPLLVPRSYVARMEPGNRQDPLLLQVLPESAEAVEVPGFGVDPLAELNQRTNAGLLQKYHGRALLITTGACAIHCRYCFRRHFPYDEGPRQLAEWEPTLQAIAAEESVSEVILSGGDPLTLVDAKLAELIERLASIAHVRRLRIHTRLPVVLPNRVTPELIELLSRTRLQTVLVLHANHARELQADCAAAISELRAARLTMLNQAVLLKGINDSVTALAALSERSFELGVVPYYLHQLDRVAGAAHFEVSDAVGLSLMDELRKQLPGYLVPRFVREIPGELSKTPLG